MDTTRGKSINILYVFIELVLLKILYIVFPMWHDCPKWLFLFTIYTNVVLCSNDKQLWLKQRCWTNFNFWVKLCVWKEDIPRPLQLSPTVWKLPFQCHLCLTEPKRLWGTYCNLNKTPLILKVINYSCQFCGGFCFFWICCQVKTPKLYFYIKPADNNVCLSVCGGSEILWM